jgi:Protein of unknown function (DUF1553)
MSRRLLLSSTAFLSVLIACTGAVSGLEDRVGNDRTARATLEQHQRDPANRLLARGPRFRLDAEMIPDGALLVSDLLSTKMHGPSVIPHQPEEIWRSTYSTDWLTFAMQGLEQRLIGVEGKAKIHKQLLV